MLVPSTLALKVPVTSGEKQVVQEAISYVSKPLHFQKVKKQLQEIVTEKQHAFIIFKSADCFVSGVCGRPKISENKSHGKLKIDFEPLYLYENTSEAFNSLIRDPTVAIEGQMFADALLNSKIKIINPLIMSRNNSPYTILSIFLYVSNYETG